MDLPNANIHSRIDTNAELGESGRFGNYADRHFYRFID